jgi:hypothetical protein
MILEPDEQGFLGSSAAGEDLNHDGKITIDEIVMHHSGGAAAASTPTTTATLTPSAGSDPGHSGEREHFSRFGRRDGDSGGDSHMKADDPLAKRVLTGTAGGSGPTTKEGDKRHSYRFSRGTDKLPTGLPSWFKSRDTNGDGQVSLSEYSRTMSESTVAEFRRYDSNDDGMITAKEAAKQK